MFAVYAGVAIAGVSEMSFAGDAVRGAFVGATASSLGVSPAAVGITRVAAVGGSSGRRLTQVAVQVDYQVGRRHTRARCVYRILTAGHNQVFLSSAAASSSLSTLITSIGGISLSLLQSAMANAGLTVTGVALTTPPSQAVIPAPPLPPPPPSPPPTPPPPTGCGILYQCAAGVACVSLNACGPCPPGQSGDGRTCVPCALGVLLGSNVNGGSQPRSQDTTLAGLVATDAACNTTGGFTFSWAATALDSSGVQLVPTATTPSFTLLARSLAVQANATFVLTSCFALRAAGAALLCAASNAASFAVTLSPLVALIGGGSCVVGETPFALSGAASYDPDGLPQSSLTFAWSCVRTDGSSPACTSRDGTLFAAAGTPMQNVKLAGAAGAGAVYVISLTVSAGSRSSTTNTTLVVVPGALPLVAIAGNAVLSGAKADPTQPLVLFANASAFVTGGVTARWALAAQTGASAPLLNLSDPAVSATPITSASLVLRAGALTPGVNYVFSLTATDSTGAVGRANATVVTSRPASGGWADVYPAAGVAVSTPFVITASNWTADADELPLSYRAEYIIEGSGAPPVSLTSGTFQYSNIIIAQLPAGLPAAGSVITLRVAVRSSFGAIAVVNASAVVTWPVFASTAAVATFVDSATARAAAALQSGDSTSALQVVSGLASLLNLNTSSITTGGQQDTAAQDQAAATQRASLLAIVASAVAQSSVLTTVPGAIESTAVLVCQLAASPSALSGDGAASALSVLTSLAGAGAAVSPAAAQSVTAALSSIAFAPSGAPASNGTSFSNASALTNFGAVLDVMTSLANSSAVSLAVPGQAPLTVSTPSIQMSVSLEDPATSRLLTVPLTAPGSNSSFDPLPAAALAVSGGAPVSATFLSLSFDAHGGASSNNTGLTRLVISAAAGGPPLEVSNLSTPVQFTLPASQLAANQQAACAWWDASASPPAYTSAGCVAEPNPAPAGHTLQYFAALSTWSISGPLAQFCTPLFLDCGNATARLTELSTGGFGRMGCKANSSALLRAFTGDGCQLSNTSNTSSHAACYWDVGLQAFSGSGCVAASTTRCACDRLADFTSSRKVNLPVASWSNLLGWSPALLLTKLKTVFIVVVSLFGGLLVGAAVGWRMDTHEHASTVGRLHDPACGFRETAQGAWLWRFRIDPLEPGADLAPPSGPAVELAAVLGLPFARLRAALPDEYFDTEFSAVLGRRHGLSKSGMIATHSRFLALQKPPLWPSESNARHGSTYVGRRTVRRVKGGHKSSKASLADFVDAKRGSHHEEYLEEFLGTALVLAFLQICQLCPVVTLSQQRRRAAAHFEAVSSPCGASFTDTCTKFLSLLSTLNQRSGWWNKSRLWKVILSQNNDGSWPLSTTVAFALQARSGGEVDSLKLNWLERLQDMLSGAAETAEQLRSADFDVTSLQDSTVQRFDTVNMVQRFDTASSVQRADSRSLHAGDTDTGAGDAEGRETADDPLFCPTSAVVTRMPRSFYNCPDADRVWCTLCCIALLETFNCSWLFSDGEIYGDVEVTIVDAAHGWLDTHAATHPSVAALLSDDAGLRQARRAVASWNRAWRRRVRELRTSEAIRDQMHTSHLHRAGTEVLRAICTKHETFAVFLSTPLDGLQRWQQWMIIVSLVCAQLLVSIWVRRLTSFARTRDSRTSRHRCSMLRASIAVLKCACCLAATALGPAAVSPPNAERSRPSSRTRLCSHISQTAFRIMYARPFRTMRRTSVIC